MNQGFIHRICRNAQMQTFKPIHIISDKNIATIIVMICRVKTLYLRDATTNPSLFPKTREKICN